MFTSYREGLYEQQKELATLITVAEGVNPEKLTSTKQLISIMEQATLRLPLPAMDIRPRFRYLDEQEDIYAEFRRKKTVLQDKKREEGLRIGVNRAISSRTINKINTRWGTNRSWLSCRCFEMNKLLVIHGPVLWL